MNHRLNIPDLRTQNSQQSQIDLFSRLEITFLEKYFKTMLTDQFHNHLSNVHQENFYKRLSAKSAKQIGASLFEVRIPFILQELSTMLQGYFKQNSPSVRSGEFPTALKFLHANLPDPVPNMFKEGELIFVDVRIKYEVAKIEEIPDNIEGLLSKFTVAAPALVVSQSEKQNLPKDKKNQKALRKEQEQQQLLVSNNNSSLLSGSFNNKGGVKEYMDSELFKMITSYKREYFNVILVYYGDVHFDFKKHPQFKKTHITVSGKQYKLRLFVYYVSKVALFQTFKTTNKVNVDSINDLVISFYEIKREKQRLNRSKRRRAHSRSNKKDVMGQVENANQNGIKKGELGGLFQNQKLMTVATAVTTAVVCLVVAFKYFSSH